MSPFMANEIARIHSAELVEEAARHRRVATARKGSPPRSRRRWSGRKPADPRAGSRD